MTEGFADRLAALDRVTDELSDPDDSLADDLFAVVDALDSSVTLRRTLTDPTIPAAARVGMAESLLESKVGGSALAVVRSAIELRWNGGRRLADALERQAVRAELGTAQAGGDLDGVEDELFRFSRVIEANPALSTALADRARSLADRGGLVAELLADKVGPSSLRLARRAVRARVRSAAITLIGYVDLAARLRERAVATVTVAAALDHDQLERLRSALRSQLGREVSIQQIVDPEVLGGARVEIGDEVIEGTVAGRLAEAGRRFGTTP